MGCACKNKGKIDAVRAKERKERKAKGELTLRDYIENLGDIMINVLDKLIKSIIILVASPFIILFVLISVMVSGSVKLVIPHKYFNGVTENVAKEL